jgi:hypothetical protein
MAASGEAAVRVDVDLKDLAIFGLGEPPNCDGSHINSGQEMES